MSTPIIPLAGLEIMIDSATGDTVSGFDTAVNNNITNIHGRVSNLIIDVAGIQNSIYPELNPSINNILPLFQYQTASIINFPDIESEGIIYPGFTVNFPAGYYIKTESIPLINIEKIVDSDEFVKMRIEERDYISSLRSTIDTNNIFKLQIEEGSPLSQTVKFTSGSSLIISQIAGSTVNDPMEVKFDSSIPLDYYHLSKYSITPTKPDPGNPYRYKVNSGPYISGSLRVYVDTHRIPNESIDQSFASSGEFRFNSSIPLSELPTSSKQDFILCDFDIPLFTGPESIAGDLGNWWGDIITQTDSGVLEPNEPLKPIRYYPLIGNYSSSSGFQIRNSNPYGSTDIGVDTVYFIIDISQIDHNLLKNYDADRHHSSSSDNQNLWFKIIDPSSGFIQPASQAADLSLTSSDSSIDINVSGSSIDFKLDSLNIINLNPATGFTEIGSIYCDQYGPVLRGSITSSPALQGNNPGIIIENTGGFFQIANSIGDIKAYIDDIGLLNIKTFSQSTQPTAVSLLANGNCAFWIDTDDNKTYLLYRFNGSTVKKVQLT